MVTVLKYIGLIVGSYLLGSIMFAKLISKKQNDDIGSHGSGNPGTMNMLRTHGVMFGFLTFILDALKGAISALVGYLIFGGADGGLVARMAIYIGGFCAVIGHIWPVFFKFKGGKGVATTAGIVFVAHPLIGLILFVAYIILLIVTKIGSLSSLLIAVAYIITDTVLLILENNYVGLVLIYIIFILIVWAHRANIKRLIEKRENLVDLKAAAQKDIDRINARKQRKNKNDEIVVDAEIVDKTNNENLNDVSVSENNDDDKNNELK